VAAPPLDDGNTGEEYMMARVTRQLECLNCSHARSFVHHTETAQRLLTQAETRALPRGATLTCGRCGSASLLYSWGDGIPCATQGRPPRRRQPAGAGLDAAVAGATRTRDTQGTRGDQPEHELPRRRMPREASGS
jgi:hypothetical protein